jgi:hypothetical protein
MGRPDIRLRHKRLPPALRRRPEEAGVTTVLKAPYTLPLDYLRWPIQFQSNGTAQTNDVIVAVDHWSLRERV